MHNSINQSHTVLRFCQNDGSWSADPRSIICIEPECHDPVEFEQAHGRLLDPIFKLVGMGVETAVTGYNTGDTMNITCRHEDGFVMNSDQHWVEATCQNHSWVETYVVQFDDNGETRSNRILNGSLPSCFRDFPRFESILSCEAGCQAGMCREANNSLGEIDGFTCQCAPGHTGFNCSQGIEIFFSL